MSFKKAKSYFQKALNNLGPSYEVDVELRRSFERKEKKSFYRGLIYLVEGLEKLQRSK